LEVIDSLARPACLVCPDFSAEFSDLSFGGLGSRDGYTTVVIRSEQGRDLYVRALEDGYIEEREYGSAQAARSDGTKMRAMVAGFTQKKRARAFRNLRKARARAAESVMSES
jgi:coenzyme F420 hydrogenase subunit beta